MVQYSKQIKNLIQVYGLTPEEVTMAALLAIGANKREAYLLSHGRNVSTNPQAKANQLLKEKPSLLSCADYLARIYIIDDVQTIAETKSNKVGKKIKPKAQEETEEEKGENKDNKGDKKPNKDETLKMLQAIANNPHSGQSVRIQALKAISDIEQFKHQTDKEETKQTHIFLPLTCKRCNLYLANRDKQRE